MNGPQATGLAELEGKLRGGGEALLEVGFQGAQDLARSWPGPSFPGLCG